MAVQLPRHNQSGTERGGRGFAAIAVSFASLYTHSSRFPQLKHFNFKSGLP
jgi:hypothetical protein